MKKLLSTCLALAMVLTMLPTAVFATEDEINSAGYIEIKTVDDLKAISSNLSGSYILMNDINLGGRLVDTHWYI